MTYNFVDPKTVLCNAKSQTLKYFKFWWLAMILIGALPTVYSALRAAIRREGQSHIVVAQQISPTI